MNRKLKQTANQLLESIDKQPDEIWLEALRADRNNEIAVRANTADTRWCCEEAIKWDVDGIEERLRVMGMEPMADVIICKICRQPTESNNCGVPCGCQGSCLPCLEKARDTSGLCPHPACGQKIDHVLTLNGKLVTKSKEAIEAEKISQAYNALIAGDVGQDNNDQENQGLLAGDDGQETSDQENHRYQAVAGPSGIQRNRRSISSNSSSHGGQSRSRSASPRRNKPKRKEGK